MGRTETPSEMIPLRCVSVFCFFWTFWSGKAPVSDSLFFLRSRHHSTRAMGHVSPDTCLMIVLECVIVIVTFQSSNLCSVLTQPSKPCVSNHKDVHVESCLLHDESVSMKRIRPTLFPSVHSSEPGPTQGCEHPLNTQGFMSLSTPCEKFLS